MAGYALVFKRPPLERKIVPRGFVTFAGLRSTAHLTGWGLPTCHTLLLVGSRILGTQTSLVTTSTGAARTAEAEKKRTAKVVVNFIVIVRFGFVEGGNRG